MWRAWLLSLEESRAFQALFSCGLAVIPTPGFQTFSKDKFLKSTAGSFQRPRLQWRTDEHDLRAARRSMCQAPELIPEFVKLLRKPSVCSLEVYQQLVGSPLMKKFLRSPGEISLWPPMGMPSILALIFIKAGGTSYRGTGQRTRS